MYLCVCVCTYVCMYVLMCVFICTCVYVCICVRVCTCVYLYVCVYVWLITISLSLGEIVLYNIFYEVFTACTSIIGQAENGHLFHARNLDFGLLMG